MSQSNLLALVVEDDNSWQQILSEILSDFGLTVSVASNLDEATRFLRSEPHRIAIVDLMATGDPATDALLLALEQLREPCEVSLLSSDGWRDVLVEAGLRPR